MSTPSSRPKSVRAFSLVELLTVIAIIGVLAGVIFPVLGIMRQSSQRNACASNMRQVGLAMAAYVQDQKSKMPGPLYSGMEANYQGSPDDNKLGSFIAPYLDIYQPAKGVDKRGTVFACPAWSTVAPASQKFWRIQHSALLTSGAIASPFGYRGSSQPRSLLEVANPTKTAALSDIDRLNWTEASNWVPATPAHGTVRNTLFLDWHVEAVTVPTT